MDLDYIVKTVVSACDSRLVGYHRNWDSGIVETRNRFCRPRDEFHSVRRADISVINDNRPVAIQQNPGPSHLQRTIRTMAHPYLTALLSSSCRQTVDR